MENSWSNPQETMKTFKMRKRKRKAKGDSDEDQGGATMRNESTISIDGDDTSTRLFGSLFYESQNTFIDSRNLKNRRSGQRLHESTVSISGLYPVDFSHLCTSTPKVDEKAQKKRSSSIPMDFRLGTKVKITARRPFPWMSKELIGNHKVPITDSDIDLAIQLMTALDSKASLPPMVLLHAASSYHQFPLIYGVTVFPRLQSVRRSSLGGLISLQSFGPTFIETIGEEWRESIVNLYASWKCGRRAFFYSLSPSFTILFTRTREMKVVITPTTSGFRQVLKEKGINFTLPLKPDMFVDLDGDDCPVEFQPLEEDHSVEMDHDEWLRDIGISPRRTLRLSRASALDNSGSANETVSGKAVANLFGTNRSDEEDNQESSRTTMLISGEESIEEFFKYFVESRVGNTRSGPHSGLPSTLLAASPFHRSVLRQLKVSSCAARRDGEMKYTVELSDGPVLPCVSEAVFPQDGGDGKLRLQVNGRTAYSGINEVIGNGDSAGNKDGGLQQQDELGGPVNVFEIEFDFATREYTW